MWVKVLDGTPGVKHRLFLHLSHLSLNEMICICNFCALFGWGVDVKERVWSIFLIWNSQKYIMKLFVYLYKKSIDCGGLIVASVHKSLCLYFWCHLHRLRFVFIFMVIIFFKFVEFSFASLQAGICFRSLNLEYGLLVEVFNVASTLIFILFFCQHIKHIFDFVISRQFFINLKWNISWIF